MATKSTISKTKVKFFAMQVLLGNIEFNTLPSAYMKAVKQELKETYNYEMEETKNV